MKNHYKILGLEQGASAEDIKKAYRSLANKYHPDKHVGSADAGKMEEKFKEVKAAYEALTSPNESLGAEYTAGWGDAGRFTDMSEILEQLRRARQQQQSTPLVNIRVDIKTALAGTKVPISVYGKSIAYQLRAGLPAGIVFQDEVPVDDKMKPVQIRIIIEQEGFQFRQIGSYDGIHFSGDLETQLEVDVIEIMLGGWKSVKSFNGDMLSVRVPRGFEFQRQKLRVASQGYFNWKKDAPAERGDLFIQIIPRVTPIAQLDPVLVEQLYKETRSNASTPS